MSGPDGPEERTAYAEEASQRDADRIDAIEDRAEGELMDIASDRLTSLSTVPA